MHDTAFVIGRKFFEIYLTSPSATIVEIGALNVNGTLRDCCPPTAIYLGLDFEFGPGVDIVLKPKEPLPLRSEFADVVLLKGIGCERATCVTAFFRGEANIDDVVGDDALSPCRRLITLMRPSHPVRHWDGRCSGWSKASAHVS